MPMPQGADLCMQAILLLGFSALLWLNEVDAVDELEVGGSQLLCLGLAEGHRDHDLVSLRPGHEIEILQDVLGAIHLAQCRNTVNPMALLRTDLGILTDLV